MASNNFQNNFVNNYIDELASKLNAKYPNLISEEQIFRAKAMYENSSKNIDEIKQELDTLAQNTIEEYLTRKAKEEKFRAMMVRRKKNAEQDYHTFIDPIKFEKVTNQMLKDGLSKEEIDARLELMNQGLMQDSQVKRLNDSLASNNGEWDFSNIRQSMESIFADKTLGDALIIYGGTVPYLITGLNPKRVIEDIDTFANLEDMAIIRQHIEANPDFYQIVYDSTSLCGEDYGLEFSTKGVNVSIFPTIASKEGMVVKNFSVHPSTAEITTASTLYHGFDKDAWLETYYSHGIPIKSVPPEFVYYTKNASNMPKRPKDIIDLKVLSTIIDKEKIEQLHSSMQVPEVLEKSTRKIITPASFTERSFGEQQLYTQIKDKNKAISQQQLSKDKPKTLKRTPNQSTTNNSNNGFANTYLMLSLIAFLAIITFIFTYIICK